MTNATHHSGVESLEEVDEIVRTPPAEIRIDEPLVRALIQEQYPEFAKLHISPIASGWDNAMFRLGTEFVVRLPRRALAAELVRNEQRWLPTIANRVPIPVPLPLCVGVPGCEYPWFWSIVPWIKGESADVTPPGPDEAARFAGFLRALHVKAPNEAPHNPWRGVPLRSRVAAVEERFQQLVSHNVRISSHIVNTWRFALRARENASPTWIHGDLHPRNVLAQEGKITGIIDWGDISSGDRATDLASLWMLFSERVARERALLDYGADADTVLRAKGWAVLFAVMLLDNGIHDHPRHAAIGYTALRQLHEDYA